MTPSLTRAPSDRGRRVLLVRAIEEAFRPIYANTVSLSLLWVKAGIREYGHDVEVKLVDWNGLGAPTAKRQLLWLDHAESARLERFRAELESFRPAIVAISAYSCFFPLALAIARATRAHDPRVPILLGGFHATAYPNAIAKYGDFDYFVRGEGVRVGPQLINALFDGRPALADIPSVALRDLGGAAVTTPLETLPALDLNPPIDWRDVDHDAYANDRLFQVVGEHHLEFPRGKLVLYEASQGCRYQCAFCEQRIQHGNQARHFSTARVIADLRRIKDSFDCEGVFFTDEYMHYDRAWFDELLTALETQALGLKYTMAVKADEIDEKLIDRIIAAGFVQLSSYPESASPRILKAMRKPIDLGKHIRVMEHASSQGLLVFTGLVVGWPGETREEVERSLALAERPFSDFVHLLPVAYLGRSEIARYLPQLRIEPDTPEYFRMLNMPTDYCLADYSAAELGELVDGRGHRINRAKIESAGTRAKLARLGWRLVTIEAGGAMPTATQPAAGASPTADVAASVGGKVDRSLLPALADTSYVIASHSVHPAEEEFKGAIIIKLRLQATEAELGVHVYPRMDRPCYAQTGHFNVCLDSRGNCSAGQRALLRRFIARLRSWEEHSSHDEETRALIETLRQPRVETRQ
jgi:radical SAM superfamily enzyme YgiQ (UPF0313 family)